MPVKKVLKSVDIDCEFVVSTPLDTIHEGAVECVNAHFLENGFYFGVVTKSVGVCCS